MNKGAKEKTNQRAQCNTKPFKTQAINIFYSTNFVRKDLFII
jgi:hypothetical protein